MTIFLINQKAKIVFLKDISCNAKSQKSGYANFVCTMRKTKFDAAIFSGEDAATIFSIFSDAGASKVRDVDNFSLKVSNIRCELSGNYSDGTFEHTCTAKTESSIPIASLE